MQSRKIGVLLGGLSSEREVSLRTGEAVLAALRERGHDAVPIYVDRDIDVALRQEQIDVAFIALHGRWGEDGCIQGLLELLGIPYTGSDVMASALAMHKGKAKELFRLHNLPTPAYYTLTVARTPRDLAGVHGDFGFPCVVKPIREGSSVGVAICHYDEELAPAVEKRAVLRRRDPGRAVHRRQGSLGRDPRRPRARRRRDRAARRVLRLRRTSTRKGATDYFVPPRLSPERYRGVPRPGAARAPGARLQRRDPRRHDGQRLGQRVHPRGQHASPA